MGELRTKAPSAICKVRADIVRAKKENNVRTATTRKNGPGRFREPLDTAFESWQRSFPFDWRLLPHEVEASIAHARAIQAAGILTSEELLQMEQGLRTVAKLENIAANQQAEDIHHFVELELTKQIGDLALKLHAGRSRNEQIATDMRLFIRAAIDDTLEGLNEWRTALIDLAEDKLTPPSCPVTPTCNAPSRSTSPIGSSPTSPC